MALTPDNNTELLDQVDEETADDSTADLEPSLTYELNFYDGTIGDLIDGTDALKQFIYKAIITARSRYLIYTDDYGCELEDLLGGTLTPSLLETEVERMVTEALIYDDRIDDVTDIESTQVGDTLTISFTVVPVTEAPFEMEVNVDV
jgi:phage baseplate assembly protein W